MYKIFDCCIIVFIFNNYQICFVELVFLLLSCSMFFGEMFNLMPFLKNALVAFGKNKKKIK